MCRGFLELSSFVARNLFGLILSRVKRISFGASGSFLTRARTRCRLYDADTLTGRNSPNRILIGNIEAASKLYSAWVLSQSCNAASMRVCQPVSTNQIILVRK